MKKTILSILKQTETEQKTRQRRLENPVYQDSYKTRTATLLERLNKTQAEAQKTPPAGKETK